MTAYDGKPFWYIIESEGWNGVIKHGTTRNVSTRKNPYATSNPYFIRYKHLFMLDESALYKRKINLNLLDNRYFPLWLKRQGLGHTQCNFGGGTEFYNQTNAVQLVREFMDYLNIPIVMEITDDSLFPLHSTPCDDDCLKHSICEDTKLIDDETEKDDILKTLMGNSLSTQDWHKTHGIQLVGQGGKTRKMEEKITEFMLKSRMEDRDDDLNIMITSNNKLLVEQTSTRLHTDLGPTAIVENVMIDSDDTTSNSVPDSESDDDDGVILKNGSNTWTSDTSLSIKELAWDIINNEVNMIVCCGNPKRFKKLNDLVEELSKSRLFNKNINIWIDEAHKSLKIWSKFESVLTLPKVSCVYIVTASWGSIQKKYAERPIRRTPYEKSYPDVYRTLRELEWITVEPTSKSEDSSLSAPSYLLQIMDSDLASKFNDHGMYLIPGNSKQASHNSIATYLIELGWNGLKLNGKDKVFYIQKDDDVVEERDFIEFNKEKKETKDALSKLIGEFNLYDSHFFVTGLNCIKEGITFQGVSEGGDRPLLFAGAILPPISDIDDAYQLACRLAGNIKHILPPGLKKPFIITTAAMKKKILREENINIFLPRILFEEGRDIPTQFDIKRAARGKCSHDHKGTGYRVFRKHETMRDFLKVLGYKPGFTNRPNGKDKYTGMFVCSVQSSRGASQRPRYVTEVIDKIDLAYGGGGGSRTCFPAYLTMTECDGVITAKEEDLVWVAVIRASTDPGKLLEADRMYKDETEELLKLAKPIAS